MFYKMDCRATIAAQDADYPTYKKLDCTLKTLANDDNFYGRLIDCQLAVIRTLVTACTNWNQGIRTKITIDSQDVTSALVGAINISRRKNQIATFSLQLNNTDYSPLINPHIFPNKEVVIISYLNRHEAILFTGLIDDMQTSWDGSFIISINGSGYGKKIRDARKTLVSIQDSATSKYRGDLIKYLAQQGGISISNINTTQGSYTRIDHSFEDQSILDMINKELVIDSMQWEFDENKVFNTFLDEIKSSTTKYPTPDWTYGEDRFFYLTLGNSDDNIVNDVKILGTVYETQLLVDDADSGGDSPYNQYYYGNTLFSDSHSFSNGEDPTTHTKTVGVLKLGIAAYRSDDNYKIYRLVIGCEDPNDWKDYTVTSKDYEFNNVTLGRLYDHYVFAPNYIYGTIFTIVRKIINGVEQSFNYNITLHGYSSLVPGESQESQSDETSDTYDYQYDQVAVHITNQYSIDKYGRRKPNTQGTVEFPLAENTDRCKEIGRKIIKDSHRYTKQPTFEVPFNPLLKVGQTISITDKKIGYSQRWYVEEVNHTIEQGKGRTRVGCVYYT